MQFIEVRFFLEIKGNPLISELKNAIWVEEFEKATFRVEAQILKLPNGCYIRRQLRMKWSSGDLRQQSFKFFHQVHT